MVNTVEQVYLFVQFFRLLLMDSVYILKTHGESELNLWSDYKLNFSRFCYEGNPLEEVKHLQTEMQAESE